VHIVVYRAVEPIAEAALGVQLEVLAEDLAGSLRIHPTLSESLVEVCAQNMILLAKSQDWHPHANLRRMGMRRLRNSPTVSKHVSRGGSERSLPWDTSHCTLWVHVCRLYSGVP
jgi:hypothetical protein